MEQIPSFLVHIIPQSANGKQERRTLRKIIAQKPEITSQIDKDRVIITNSSEGVELILKIIKNFHPFVWVYSMIEVFEFQLKELLNDKIPE